MLENLSDPTETDNFRYEANEAIAEMIPVHTAPEEELNLSDVFYAKETKTTSTGERLTSYQYPSFPARALRMPINSSYISSFPSGSMTLRWMA
mmetsp:Transcript_14810/g.23998  ORF Transcript_14810/g.23998 Transcript_14810/m.23998 type:complete len:93 (-) Transcript_14810:375-653(-)